MRDQQQIVRPYDDRELSARITYFVIGGAIGAVAALLLAPKSGHELRGDIADVTRKGVVRTRETAGHLGARAGDFYQAASSKAGEVADVARGAAARKGEQLTAAIEAGKQAFIEEKQRISTDTTTPTGELDAAIKAGLKRGLEVLVGPAPKPINRTYGDDELFIG